MAWVYNPSMDMLTCISSLNQEQAFNLLYVISYHIYSGEFQEQIVSDFLCILNSNEICKVTYEKYQNRDSLYSEPESKYCCLVVFSVLAHIQQDEIFEKVKSILIKYDVEGIQKDAFQFVLDGYSDFFFKETEKERRKNNLYCYKDTLESLLNEIHTYQDIADGMKQVFENSLMICGIDVVPYKEKIESILYENKKEWMQRVSTHENFLSLSKEEQVATVYLCVYSTFFDQYLEQAASLIDVSLDLQTNQMEIRKEKKVNELQEKIRKMEEDISLLSKEIQNQKRLNKNELNSLENKISKEFRNEIAMAKKEMKDLNVLVSQKEFESFEVKKLREAMYLVEKNLTIHCIESTPILENQMRNQSIVFVGATQSIEDFLKRKYPKMIFVKERIPKQVEKANHIFFYYQNMKKEVYDEVIKIILRKRISFDYITAKENAIIEKEMLTRLYEP